LFKPPSQQAVRVFILAGAAHIRVHGSVTNIQTGFPEAIPLAPPFTLRTTGAANGKNSSAKIRNIQHAEEQRRGDPVLCVFDCLSLDSLDLRTLPLAERKRRLKRLVRGHPGILFAGHVERHGTALFRTVCEHNIEGTVAKRKDGEYGQDWFKIRNPGYSPLRR
jgi:ATP dependent DNA ligase domain